MLEFYFKSPKRLEQLRSGPLAEHIGRSGSQAPPTGLHAGDRPAHSEPDGQVQRDLRPAPVSREPAGIDDALAERFINEELRAEGTFREAGSLLRHMLEHLRSEGVIQQAAGGPV